MVTPEEHLRLSERERIERLAELVRIPSVSTDPDHHPDVLAAASWLVAHLTRIGLHAVEMVDTGGLPVVVGEWLEAGENAPTLVHYGHYDVQPVDPVDEWERDPFSGEVEDGRLWGRGASDDKGQLLAILDGVEAFLATEGALPVNLKVVLEGSEEVASRDLPAFLDARREWLVCDAVLAADSAMLDPSTPLILTGVRGNTYLQLTVAGPAFDLHSGTFGGAIDNPAMVLSRLLAALHDPRTRKVAVPGFYDRVAELSPQERAEIRRGPATEELLRQLTGVPRGAGEEGYSVAEWVSTRPTCDVTGVSAGYTGPGRKNVIPATATAKVSFRLVPDQDPDEIAELVETYLRSLAPDTVTLSVERLGGSNPAVVDPASLFVQAAAAAYQDVMNAPPVFLRGGGSEPMVAMFQRLLGVPVVLPGFGLPSDNHHAPNEKLELDLYRLGAEWTVRYLRRVAGVPSRQARRVP